MDLKERITVVINTLQQLEIKSTYDNMNYLLGSIQELRRISAELQAEDGEETCGE